MKQPRGYSQAPARRDVGFLTYKIAHDNQHSVDVLLSIFYPIPLGQLYYRVCTIICQQFSCGFWQI